MKTLVMTAIIAFYATTALAEKPSMETAKIAKILVNNPVLVNELNKNNTDTLSDVKAEAIKQGITKYTLSFKRSCYCEPMGAKVTITEDLTPTYSDGAPEYTYSIEIFQVAN